MEMNREEAWRLLNTYTKNPNLVKHALAVEAAMRAYAGKFGEDVEKWGLVGLLHDFDYDLYPDEHPMKGAAILDESGYPADVVRAIRSHANVADVPRITLMEKTLFAVDEACGFVTAATLVRPGKRVAELPVESVIRRMKDKAFARAVNRDDIRNGAAELGVDLAEHLGFIISAMTRVADQLGLDGKD